MPNETKSAASRDPNSREEAEVAIYWSRAQPYIKSLLHWFSIYFILFDDGDDVHRNLRIWYVNQLQIRNAYDRLVFYSIPPSKQASNSSKLNPQKSKKKKKHKVKTKFKSSSQTQTINLPTCTPLPINKPFIKISLHSTHSTYSLIELQWFAALVTVVLERTGHICNGNESRLHCEWDWMWIWGLGFV